MIDKQDILLLLNDLQNNDIDVKEQINNLYKYQNSLEAVVEALKKINSYRPLDLVNFYTKIRTSYNKKKSKLYINIMKSNENAIEDINTILTTLSAMLNLILLYKCEDRAMFLKHARADEITKVINLYLTTFNILPAFKLLKLIKADIITLEVISGKR